MTIAFSSKVVEKHKKVGNKKVLTGRLLRQRIKKQNKKLARSGKVVCTRVILYYCLSAGSKSKSSNDEDYKFSEHF